MSNVIVIHSGGLDSTVLLYKLLADGDEVKALSVNYGQRHVTELSSAAAICRELGVDHKIADLRSISPLLAGSSQTSWNIPVPHGHYAAENMKTTVVPNRNMIMLSIAIGWAVSIKADSVAYAAHAGDHTIYPDCRKEFVSAMEHAAMLCDWHQVKIARPFVDLTKAEIVKLGAELHVPFAATYSCYQGNTLHCGQCGTCQERREAFELAGVSDPTLYH